MLYKRYVNVLAYFDKMGKITPKAIIWDDGISYEIDKILRICNQEFSKVGGGGTMFKCMIGGRERTLFFERGKSALDVDQRWFIESEKP